MFVTFLGRSLSLLLTLAPAVFVGLVLLFLLAFLRPALRGKGLAPRRLRSVSRGAGEGMISPAAGSEASGTAGELLRQGACADAGVAFFTAKASAAPEGLAATAAILGPVAAIIRPAVAWLASFIMGFFLTPATGMHKLKKTDPAKWKELREADRAEQKAAREPLPALSGGERLREAACVTLRSAEKCLPGFVIGCVIGAGFATALPGTFFTDVAFSNHLALYLIIIAVGFLAGAPAVCTAPVALGLMACGMGPGPALLMTLVPPVLNLTELFRMGMNVGRGKTVLYMLAHALLSLAACKLAGDLAAAGLVSFPTPALPTAPGEVAVLGLGIAALVLLAGLFIAALLGKREEAPVAEEGDVILTVSGTFGEDTETLLREAFEREEGLRLVRFSPRNGQIVLQGEGEFETFARVCSAAGLQLDGMTRRAK